ncbi:MAG: thioesterase family protein [Chloroflexota bacterium]
MSETQLPEKILTIPPEWIDRNGHVNVAYYVLAFDYATDAFYDTLGIGEAYQEKGFSVFTLGMNVDYLREIFEGTKIRMTTQLINWDKKRLHYFHRMFNLDAGYLAATNECIAMHIDLNKRKSAPFSAETNANIEATMNQHAQLSHPHSLVRKL